MRVEYKNQDIYSIDLLYVQNNEVYIENKQAHWGITRAILSIFGGRDYRLESILAKHDVKELSIKQAKKCGLDASIIDVLNDPKNTKNVDFLTPELNGKLMQLMKTAGKQWSPDKKNVMKTLCGYTHKVNSLDKFKALEIGKIDHNNLSNHTKMSLKDLRLIETMAKATTLALTLANWGIAQDETVKDFTAQAKLAERFSNDVRAKADSEELSKQAFRVVFYDFDVKQGLYGSEKLTQLMINTVFRANASHISVMYPEKNGVMQEAHMWGEPSTFNHGRMPLVSYAFPTLSVDFEKSVPEDKKATLQNHYGEDWVAKLEKKYAAKLAEFYSNDELKKLTNPSFHRLMGFIKTRNNPLQSWRDQLDFDTSNQVFCSEFTAKSLLKAFVELEKEIRSDLKDEAFELEPPINMWRRIGNVFASTLWKKRGDERYQFHNAPQIIQQLFELPKAR